MRVVARYYLGRSSRIKNEIEMNSTIVTIVASSSSSSPSSCSSRSRVVLTRGFLLSLPSASHTWTRISESLPPLCTFDTYCCVISIYSMMAVTNSTLFMISNLIGQSLQVNWQLLSLKVENGFMKFLWGFFDQQLCVYIFACTGATK